MSSYRLVVAQSQKLLSFPELLHNKHLPDKHGSTTSVKQNFKKNVDKRTENEAAAF